MVMPHNYTVIVINMNKGDDCEDGCEIGGLYESRGNAK